MVSVRETTNHFSSPVLTLLPRTVYMSLWFQTYQKHLCWMILVLPVICCRNNLEDSSISLLHKFVSYLPFLAVRGHKIMTNECNCRMADVSKKEKWWRCFFLSTNNNVFLMVSETICAKMKCIYLALKCNTYWMVTACVYGGNRTNNLNTVNGFLFSRAETNQMVDSATIETAFPSTFVQEWQQ